MGEKERGSHYFFGVFLSSLLDFIFNDNDCWSIFVLLFCFQFCNFPLVSEYRLLYSHCMTCVFFSFLLLFLLLKNWMIKDVWKFSIGSATSLCDTVNYVYFLSVRALFKIRFFFFFSALPRLIRSINVTDVKSLFVWMYHRTLNTSTTSTNAAKRDWKYRKMWRNYCLRKESKQKKEKRKKRRGTQCGKINLADFRGAYILNYSIKWNVIIRFSIN